MIRIATTLALAMIAFGAFAQTDEFGRTFGGEIQAITKQPRTLSGSLGLMRGSGDGYEATLGGSLIKDKVWFFASALKLPALTFEPSLNLADAKITAQPVDWTMVSATYSERPSTLPSSFLSLRSTSILSDRMVFNISVSRDVR